MHHVPSGAYLWRGTGFFNLPHDVPRGVLLPPEHRNDGLRRGHVQREHGRELGGDVLVVHGCSRELLPCSEHCRGWHHVPQRLLLRRCTGGGGAPVVRLGHRRDQRGLRRSRGFYLVRRRVCYSELRCRILLPRRHRAAAVPRWKVREHAWLYFSSCVPRVHCDGRLVLPSWIAGWGGRAVPYWVLLCWYPGGSCRMHVHRGLQLPFEVFCRGNRVDGQLRYSVPGGLFLYCIDAPARVSSRHVQHWRDHVHLRRDVPAVQRGHVRPYGAWRGW